jgi:hypothetical protein
MSIRFWPGLQGWSQTEAYLRLGYTADARDYTSAAAILRDLGVRSIRLLTNNPEKSEGLQAAGIPIAGTHSLAVDPGTNERLRRRYAEKRQRNRSRGRFHVISVICIFTGSNILAIFAKIIIATY